MNDSTITCDEVIESCHKETKTIPTNFNEKKATAKNFYILLAFLLITIAILIAVSIYGYLTEYQVKKNIYSHLTPKIPN